MTYAALPPVPTSGLTDAEFQLLAAIHENISLLTGQPVTSDAAVTLGQISLSGAPDSTIPPSLLANTADLATVALLLQYLINDVQSLRDTVNTLITQLRS